MRVTVDQSGGFVGYTRQGVDTTDLKPEEASELRSLVEQTKQLGAAKRTVQAFGNAPSYEITVETEQGAQRYELDDLQAESVRPLLEFVQQRGKPLPPP